MIGLELLGCVARSTRHFSRYARGRRGRQPPPQPAHPPSVPPWPRPRPGFAPWRSLRRRSRRRSSHRSQSSSLSLKLDAPSLISPTCSALLLGLLDQPAARAGLGQHVEALWLETAPWRPVRLPLREAVGEQLVEEAWRAAPSSSRLWQRREPAAGQEAQLVERAAARPALQRRAALLVFMRPANSLAGPLRRRGGALARPLDRSRLGQGAEGEAKEATRRRALLPTV